MKIVKIKGGLGNQMFQYAFALLLRKISNDHILLDFSSFKDLGRDLVRKPRILKFKIQLGIANKNVVSELKIFNNNHNFLSLRYKIFTLFEILFNKKYFFEKNRKHTEIKSIKHYSYFDGYWQSWKIVDKVKRELLNDFDKYEEISTASNKFIQKIRNENAVFVGIRMGDYKKDKRMIDHFGSFNEDYYLRAMQYLSNKIDSPKFYIFSNDISWVKDNMKFDGFNVKYREENEVVNDFEELIIMRNFKHAIIVNSTFYWWGAWLIKNKKKIVLAPKKWFNDNKPIDIICPDWITIDR